MEVLYELAVSEPKRPSSRLGCGCGSHRGRRRRAGLMYLLDPVRGRARRTAIQDQTIAIARRGARHAARKLADIEHRAKGVLHQACAAFRSGEPVHDRKLEARVHTNLGRAIADPHAVRVMSLSGHVVVGGKLPAAEIPGAMKVVEATRGVLSVENRLEPVAPVPGPRRIPVSAVIPALFAAGTGFLAALQGRRH